MKDEAAGEARKAVEARMDVPVATSENAAAGVEIPYVIKARRPGNIATCYSDASKAKEEPGRTAENGIREMCEDSWRWQSQNPNGYEDSRQEEQ